MAYPRTFWLDHVTDQEGHVIQQGTLLDQQHFNNMEVGISDAHIALAMLQFQSRQQTYNDSVEQKTVDLLMNAGTDWPFNNRETTVALSQARENTNYQVDVFVLDYSGGRLGNIRVLDRALNGFKLLHDGSATAVKVSLRISGGMTDPPVASV